MTLFFKILLAIKRYRVYLLAWLFMSYLPFAAYGQDLRKAENPNQVIAWIIIFLIWAIFLLLAVRTTLLRDPVDPTHLPANKKPGYSLARCQIAIWTTIVGSVYIYSKLYTGCTAEKGINETALILMGISAGTVAIGSLMDKQEIVEGTIRHQDAPASGNFFLDIVSDENGVSIHRFQNVIWTVISIIMYFYSYNNPKSPAMCMPELDKTLLALSGISSAAYLTLKAKENVQSPAEKAAAEAKLAAAQESWKADTGSK